MRKQQWNVTDCADGYVEGNIDVLKDGIMFTSIPYDDGWKIFIDGKEVKTIPLLGNAFLGVELEQGYHEVKMYYETPGKIMGEIVSCIAWISILAMCTLPNMLKRKRRK